jgi:hypothetical protein
LKSIIALHPRPVMFAHKALPHYEQTGKPKNFATEPRTLGGNRAAAG